MGCRYYNPTVALDLLRMYDITLYGYSLMIVMFMFILFIYKSTLDWFGRLQVMYIVSGGPKHEVAE